ncbi:hypothetical protein HanPSC8_Chr13g0593401 [Helianthus annuus]|nr:hypothetical protein HanPSC8_Chr13g0593401 [Helianthus annuus]
MTGLLNYCSFLCCQFTVSLFLMFYQTLHFDIRFLNSVMHFDLAHCIRWTRLCIHEWAHLIKTVSHDTFTFYLL